MLRMAPLALSTALATAPGLAGAQAPGQLDALKQAIRICSDPTVMPGDWDARLEGWQKIDPPTELAGRLAADREFYRLVYNPVGRDSLSPAATEGLLSEMSGRIVEQVEAADFGISDDDVVLSFYRHPSDWLLALEIEPSDPSTSTCMVSHAAPDADVRAHLEAPFMQTQPFPTIGGRGMQVEASIADGTFDGADLGYYIFLKDPYIFVKDADILIKGAEPLLKDAGIFLEEGAFSPTGIAPEIDPLRLASAASMTILNYAAAREGE